DLGKLVKIDVGNDRTDAVDRQKHALVFQTSQNAPNGCAARLELLGEIVFGKAHAGWIIEKADPHAQCKVDLVEPLAGIGQTFSADCRPASPPVPLHEFSFLRSTCRAVAPACRDRPGAGQARRTRRPCAPARSTPARRSPTKYPPSGRAPLPYQRRRPRRLAHL